MKVKLFGLLLAISEVLIISGISQPAYATGLQVTYGSSGIQQLSYNGVTLEDLSRDASDAFHIWHMSSSSLNGGALSAGQYGWGESNNGRTWNGATHTWTYSFIWGSISVQFVQSGNTLNMNVVEKNNANSGIIFNGATIYPFVLHFPRLPNGFTDPSYQQLAFNTTAASVTVADYAQGEVAAVVPDASKPLYSGFQPTGGTLAYYPIISSTSIEGMATFFPRNDRPVAPGTDRRLYRFLAICPVRHPGGEHRRLMLIRRGPPPMPRSYGGMTGGLSALSIWRVLRRGIPVIRQAILTIPGDTTTTAMPTILTFAPRTDSRSSSRVFSSRRKATFKIFKS